MKTWMKSLVVIVGAIVFSTVAINASDVFRGIEGSLLGLAVESSNPCGEYAVRMQFDSGVVCVDTYEASPSDSCDIETPKSEIDTQINVADVDCHAVSRAAVVPWRFVSLSQAQQLCARTGKRLLTSEEWFTTSLGMSDFSSCAVSTGKSDPEKTGSMSCISPVGVHDLVGNVWEWVDAFVVDGVYDGIVLPDSGYISLVRPDGLVLETSPQPHADYGNDYAWFSAVETTGIIRGGFYNSFDDAGIYTLNASVPLNFKAAGVGFRCAKDL